MGPQSAVTGPADAHTLHESSGLVFLLGGLHLLKYLAFLCFFFFQIIRPKLGFDSGYMKLCCRNIGAYFDYPCCIDIHPRSYDLNSLTDI